jgi:hypothetical protein
VFGSIMRSNVTDFILRTHPQLSCRLAGAKQRKDGQLERLVGRACAI